MPSPVVIINSPQYHVNKLKNCNMLAVNIRTIQGKIGEITVITNRLISAGSWVCFVGVTPGRKYETLLFQLCCYIDGSRVRITYQAIDSTMEPPYGGAGPSRTPSRR